MAWTIKDIKKRIFDLETRKKSIKAFRQFCSKSNWWLHGTGSAPVKH